MGLLQLCVLVLCIVTFGSFVWAIRCFFRTEEGMRPGMRLISLAGSVFMVIHLLVLAWPALQRSGALEQAVAAGTYLAALGIFWASVKVNRARPLTLAFSNDHPEHMVREGPYRFIRHPFYTSYLLAWVAGAIGAFQPWLLLSAVFMGFIYYRAARQEEAKFLSGRFGEQYRQYQCQAGMFWPRLGLAGIRRATRPSR